MSISEQHDVAASLPIPTDIPQDHAGADPHKTREWWVEIARSAAERGKLETLPTVKGVSPRGRDVARTQNHWLTKKSFGSGSAAYRAGYERIQWNREKVAGAGRGGSQS